MVKIEVRSMILNIIKFIAPTCSCCSGKFFTFFNCRTKLDELKDVDEYKPKFDLYDNLCSDCFTKLTTFPCCLCKGHFDVLNDRKKELLNNFKEYSVDTQKISSSKHICFTEL